MNQFIKVNHEWLLNLAHKVDLPEAQYFGTKRGADLGLIILNRAWKSREILSTLLRRCSYFFLIILLLAKFWRKQGIESYSF